MKNAGYKLAAGATVAALSAAAPLTAIASSSTGTSVLDKTMKSQGYENVGKSSGNINDLADSSEQFGQGVLRVIWMFAMVMGAAFFVIGIMMIRSAAKTQQPQTAGWISLGVGIVGLAAAPVAYFFAKRVANSTTG